MNVNSWNAWRLNLTTVTKAMANEKLGVATEPSPECLLLGGFTLAQWGLTF